MRYSIKLQAVTEPARLDLKTKLTYPCLRYLFQVAKSASTLPFKSFQCLELSSFFLEITVCIKTAFGGAFGFPLIDWWQSVVSFRNAQFLFCFIRDNPPIFFSMSVHRHLRSRLKEILDVGMIIWISDDQWPLLVTWVNINPSTE